MESKYDLKSWEQETKLGRRLYIHNFGMKGTELAGWELVKTSLGENSADAAEKTYIWKHKKSKEEELVQVRVVESNYWRNALQHLHDQLVHCMRPNIPRGKAKTASIGDIQHVGQTPTNETAAVFFTRGNLQISVRSVGKKPVDVVALAKKLDNRFLKPPTKTEEKAGIVSVLKPAQITVKKNERAVLIDRLPEPVSRSGWIKVITPDGELRRDGDVLYYQGEKAGPRNVEILNFKLE